MNWSSHFSIVIIIWYRNKVKIEKLNIHPSCDSAISFLGEMNVHAYTKTCTLLFIAA